MTTSSKTKRATAVRSAVTRKSFHFDGHKRKATPIEFDIEGQTFHMRPRISGLMMLDFASAVAGLDMDAEDGGSGAAGAQAAKAIRQIIELAIVPEDWPAFELCVSDPNTGLDIEELSEIAGWMVEQYTERPTE